jgi:hypothetical protein
MKTTFLPLMGAILITMLPKPGVPADVAPPPGAIAVLSLGVLLALGLFVVLIVVVSFLVTRAIKKNRPRKEGS